MRCASHTGPRVLAPTEELAARATLHEVAQLIALRGAATLVRRSFARAGGRIWLTVLGWDVGGGERGDVELLVPARLVPVLVGAHTAATWHTPGGMTSGGGVEVWSCRRCERGPRVLTVNAYVVQDNARRDYLGRQGELFGFDALEHTEPGFQHTEGLLHDDTRTGMVEVKVALRAAGVLVLRRVGGDQPAQVRIPGVSKEVVAGRDHVGSAVPELREFQDMGVAT